MRVYRKCGVVLTLLLTLIIGCAGNTTTSSPDKSIFVTLPDIDWAVKVSYPGFLISDQFLRADGKAIDAYAKDSLTSLSLSIHLQPALHKGDSRDCREYYWKLAQADGVTRDKVDFQDRNGLSFVEYHLSEYKGQKVNWHHLIQYMVKDNIWIAVHVSKTNFAVADRKLLDSSLSAVYIQENYSKTAWDYWIFGSRFFQFHNREATIENLEKAFQLEPKPLTLTRAQWLELVNLLAVTYGMSDDFGNTERVLQHGIAVVPDYPHFYYNMACCHAEIGTRESVLENLRKALEMEGNLLPGELALDPREEDFFKKFLSDRDFLALLEQFGK